MRGKTDVTEYPRLKSEIRTAFKLPPDLKEAIKSDHVRRRRRTCLECGHRFSTYEMTNDLTQAMLGWISRLVDAQPAAVLCGPAGANGEERASGGGGAKTV